MVLLGILLCLVHSFLLYGVIDDYWVRPPWLYSVNLGTILYIVNTAYSALEIGDLSLWKFVSEEYTDWSIAKAKSNDTFFLLKQYEHITENFKSKYKKNVIL